MLGLIVIGLVFAQQLQYCDAARRKQAEGSQYHQQHRQKKQGYGAQGRFGQ
ncbi:hypothetical protein SDC9_208662 [bioreactor metagenome]|uniref:Uncharacterized protein n=1 Tax=bioreactor metagenome TaxID=1076179 RepID=A0A645JE26_9ZZZZ